MIKMPYRSYTGSLPPLTEDEHEIHDRIKKHVRMLAGVIGERNLWQHEALEAAADYIEKSLGESHYQVGVQSFRVGGKNIKNLEVEIKGTSLAEEIVIVGAHYDSVIGSPGANDNATGVAALLEIARLLSGREMARTVRLVAFANEEPPHFQTEDMGSRVYARRARRQNQNIVAMLSLETIGYYSTEPGSQSYPFPFGASYPDTGNYIGFVGNLASRNLLQASIASFRRHTSFPSEGIAAPGWVMGISWSDQWSFWQEGYQGIMVTDTALFRYEHYHASTDTPDRIDYPRTARVVAGLARVVSELANGK